MSGLSALERETSIVHRVAIADLRYAATSPEPTTPFQTPLPAPLEDFDLNASEPQVYRPFRHGKTHVTLGIRKLNWDNWIEMDSNYKRYHDLKVSELDKDLGEHVQYYDDAVTRDACFEMLEELTRYLTHRYPRIFRLAHGVLSNSVTGEKLRYPAGEPSCLSVGYDCLLTQFQKRRKRR